MIFDRQPQDWRDLQNMVAQMFEELGCEVIAGEQVSLVRGKKEIDVLVRDPSTVSALLYFCECKHWQKGALGKNRR